MTLKTIILFILTVICSANIVDLKNFALAERTLVNKYRFSFSDFARGQTLRDAAVKFDLAITPQKTLNNSTYALFVIEASDEISTELENLILAEDNEARKQKKG